VKSLGKRPRHGKRMGGRMKYRLGQLFGNPEPREPKLRIGHDIVSEYLGAWAAERGNGVKDTPWYADGQIEKEDFVEITTSSFKDGSNNHWTRAIFPWEDDDEV
jgi:hypothetical protein